MNDGHANERIDEDLELVDLEPAADEQSFEDLASEEAEQSSLDGLMQLIRTSPESASLVLDVLDKALDWALAEKLAARIRSTLSAEAREQAEAVPVDPIRQTAMAADAAAMQAHRAAGRQVMAQAYEENRVVALAAVETMIAHAQVALAALKWEPENVPVIAGYLSPAPIRPAARNSRRVSSAMPARRRASRRRSGRFPAGSRPGRGSGGSSTSSTRRGRGRRSGPAPRLTTRSRPISRPGSRWRKRALRS